MDFTSQDLPERLRQKFYWMWHQLDDESQSQWNPSDKSEVLILLYRSGLEEAFNELESLYRGAIRIWAKKYYIPGAEESDVIIVAKIGFFEAVKKFRPGSLKFSQFAKMVVQRAIIDELKGANRPKQLVLINSKRFEDHPELENLILKNFMPEELETPRGQFLDLFFTSLSEMEKEVLIGLVFGEDYNSIAARISHSYKDIDNAIQRIRRKAKKLFPRTAYKPYR